MINKITLVRHGQSLANAEHQNQGSGEWLDTPLTDKGLRQASQVAKRLKTEDFDLVYCSPLTRAKETCEVIMKFHEGEILFDDRLRERHDSETNGEFVSRVREFWREVRELDKNILVVAHGGVILTLMAFTTKSKEEGGKFVRKYCTFQPNTAVNIVERDGEHYRIRMLGNISHRDREDILKHHFRLVRLVKYKICKFEPEKINEDLEFGDCRHKTFLLKKLLEGEGFEVREVKVLFDWADLPIPKNILGILKSGTKMIHESLEVKMNETWIRVDPTWNLELEGRGFPVDYKWDGLGDTPAITDGKLEYFIDGEFDKSNLDINLNKEELHSFSEALNLWLGTSVRISRGWEMLEVVELAKDLKEWFTLEGIESLKKDLRRNKLIVSTKDYSINGFLIYKIEDKVAEILWLGVRRVDWRKGIGRSLIDYFVNHCKGESVNKIRVETLTENVDYEPYEMTRAFYKKNGFSKVGFKKAEKEGRDDMDIFERSLEDAR